MNLMDEALSQRHFSLAVQLFIAISYFGWTCGKAGVWNGFLFLIPNSLSSVVGLPADGRWALTVFWCSSPPSDGITCRPRQPAPWRPARLSRDWLVFSDFVASSCHHLPQEGNATVVASLSLAPAVMTLLLTFNENVAFSVTIHFFFFFLVMMMIQAGVKWGLMLVEEINSNQAHFYESLWWK